MKNGARYVVMTHRGTFSMDEGSYQDYLAGKLWIGWTPGKPEQQVIPANHLPVNITAKAVKLRDQADSIGVLELLRKMHRHNAIVPYSNRFAELNIDEMNLTVRSSNGLKRAGIHTFGQLQERMGEENGLAHIRNIGTKSIKEIKQSFFEECYARLSLYEKARYWQEVIES